MGGFPVGFGFIFLYNSANNYLVDSYQHQAASALAAKTFLRSLWGAGCVLFTVQMYHTLGKSIQEETYSLPIASTPYEP